MHVCPVDTLYTKRHRFWWKRWQNHPRWQDLSLPCQNSHPMPVRWSPGGPDSPKPSLARRTPSRWTAVKQVHNFFSSKKSCMHGCLYIMHIYRWLNSFYFLFAGTNMLMVGVHGPKTPCEEVYVKHMGNRMYNVTYTVKEKGDYILIVKWGEEMVPGSPFHVTVP